MNIVKYFIMVAIVFFVVSVDGCGESHELREVTTKAITATIEAQSYRVTAVGTYTVDGETKVNTYEAEFVAPDRYHEKTSCVGCSDGNWSETIVIGDKSYLRSSERPQWCESPCQYDDPSLTQVTSVTSISLEKKLESLNWLVDLEKLSDQEIDGTECWHYRGKVDMDSYVDMLQKTATREDGQISQRVSQHLEEMSRWTMNFELWVEKGSCLIRQLKEDVRFTEEDLFIGSTTMRFYDFNVPISIEPPQL